MIDNQNNAAPDPILTIQYNINTSNRKPPNTWNTVPWRTTQVIFSVVIRKYLPNDITVRMSEALCNILVGSSGPNNIIPEKNAKNNNRGAIPIKLKRYILDPQD